MRRRLTVAWANLLSNTAEPMTAVLFVRAWRHSLVCLPFTSYACQIYLDVRQSVWMDKRHDRNNVRWRRWGDRCWINDSTDPSVVKWFLVTSYCAIRHQCSMSTPCCTSTRPSNTVMLRQSSSLSDRYSHACQQLLLFLNSLRLTTLSVNKKAQI